MGTYYLTSVFLEAMLLFVMLLFVILLFSLIKIECNLSVYCTFAL